MMLSGKLRRLSKGLFEMKLLRLISWLEYCVPKIIKIDIALFVLFGLPIIGVLSVAFLLGCELSAAGPKECMFLGFDIGERIYFYAIPLIGSILTPVAFLFAFFDILLVLNFPVITFFIIYLVRKKKTPPSNSSGPWDE